MARSFSSTSDYITQGTTAIPTTGMASLWVYPTWAYNDGVEHIWFRAWNSTGPKIFDFAKGDSGGGNFFFIGWYNSGTDCRVQTAASGLTQNAWNHLLLTWSSGGNSVLYLNGSSIASYVGSTSTWSTSGITRYLGKDGNANTSSAASSMAEWAVWNSASATAQDISALASGVCPLLVLPSALVDYIPIWGDGSPEPNLVSTDSGTVTGTARSSHPRAIMPLGRSKVFLPQAAVAANPFPAWLGMRQAFEEEFEYLTY
jgi:hypothetical protein